MNDYNIIISKYSYYDYNKSKIPLADTNTYRNAFVLLFNDGWNDMGYYSEFFILYFDNNADKKEIGLIKLCNKEMKLDKVYPYYQTEYFLKNDNLIENKLSSNILNNYYSIINMDTYINLLKILNEDAEVNNFIAKLQEVSTLSNDTINEIKKYDWFKESILRDFDITGSKNELIVSFTELKNKLKNKHTTYYLLNDIPLFFNSISENDLKEVYEWFENISFTVANEVVNIIVRKDISHFTNKDMLINILNGLKIKFESYTHFVYNIDEFLNLNKDFYELIEDIKKVLRVGEKNCQNLNLVTTLPYLLYQIL